MIPCWSRKSQLAGMLGAALMGVCLIRSSFDGTVRMWNGHTGDCLSIFQAGSGKVCGHSFAPKADLLAIVAGSKLILAGVHTAIGKEIFSWQDKDNLFETAWRVDGKMVAAAMENHMIAVVRMDKVNALGEDATAKAAQMAITAA